MAAKLTLKARTRDIQAQKLANCGQKIVQKDQKGFAQCSGNGLLRRHKCGLQAIWEKAEILNAVTLASLPKPSFARPIALCQHPCRLITDLKGRSHLQRRRVTEPRDQHVTHPFRASVKTDRALKNSDRRAAM